MKTNVYDNKEKFLLIFRKNLIGEYVYDSPVVASYSSYKNPLEKGKRKDYMSISRGVRKNLVIPLSSCLDSDGILSKVISDKSCSSSLKEISKFEPTDVIAVVLDPEIENYVYNMYREKESKELTINEFSVFMLAFGDRMGRSISKIEKKTLGGYSANINGSFNSLEKTSKNIIESALSTPSPKPKEAQAEAGVGPKPSIQKPSQKQVPIDDSVVFTYSDPNKNNSTKLNQSNTSSSVSKKENIDVDNKEKKDNNKIDVAGIKSEIRKKVINQDRAIDAIVNNIYFNQRYIDTGEKDLLRNKANILLDGSTGTGKTFILEEVASELNLPIFVTGVTNYSSVGYRGADLTSILYKLLERADGNLELAERGIVAFDEFDKLGGFADNDVSMRKAIQQELLTFISGTILDVEYNGKTYNFDTSKLTFIGMGAFTNLRERKIKENEKKYKSSIGFSSLGEDDIVRKYKITKDDYVDEGLERELVGRFSCLTHTNDLSVNDLEGILTQSITSPLNGLRITGNIMGCEIDIDDEIVHEIAQRAFDTNTGARGLIEIVQSLKDVIANDLFSGESKITITKEHLDAINSVHERTYEARKGY